MSKLTVWRPVVTAAVVVVGLCVPALAETLPACAERVHAQDDAAKREWQRGLRDLIVKVRPDLATLATLEMEHQLALLDRRQAQWQYLLGVDVRRIHTGEGLTSFRNFAWTEADAHALRQQGSGYRAIERKVVELERQIQRQGSWPALHTYVRTSLGESTQFQALLRRLQDREAGIERLLEGCQPSR